MTLERKPTVAQYFFAVHAPLRILLTVSTVSIATLFVWIFLPRIPFGWEFLVRMIGPILAGGTLGFFTALVLAGLLLARVYRVREVINGAPFEKGEQVRILSAPYRDKIVVVEEVLPHRRQMRLTVEPPSGFRSKKLFAYVEVCREGNGPAPKKDA